MRNYLSSFLIVMLAIPGCGREPPSPVIDPEPEAEITPEQFAQEMGLPLDSSGRTVKEADFKNYTMVVDIFRKSRSLPVLGSYDPSYASALGTSQSEAEKIFDSLARLEFAVVSLNGSPHKVQLISGAREAVVDGSYKTTPPGNYRLDPVLRSAKIVSENGTSTRAQIPYPWLLSQKYQNSKMYWGLWIFGGYFFHSTTHYWQLGVPASMGCVRQPYPDAMENFSLAQKYRAMIRIHKIGSTKAYDRLREIATVAWVLPQLRENQRRVDESIVDFGKEVVTYGHAWRDPATGAPGTPVWPRCGSVGCFSVWGKKQPGLLPEAIDLLLAQSVSSEQEFD